MVAMTENLLLGWIEVDGSRQLLHLIRRDQRVVDIVAAPDSQRLLAELASRAEDDELVCTPDLGDAAGDAWSIEPWTPEDPTSTSTRTGFSRSAGTTSGAGPRRGMAMDAAWYRDQHRFSRRCVRDRWTDPRSGLTPR
jgi:hypothetical protein